MPTEAQEIAAWHKSEIDRLTEEISKMKQQAPDSPVLEELRAQLRSHLVNLDLEQHNK